MEHFAAAIAGERKKRHDDAAEPGRWRHGQIDPVTLGEVVEKLEEEKSRSLRIRAKFDEESG
jgi:hypothetical protein